MKVVEGDPRLLKVTTADDLAKIASWLVTAVVFDVGETLVDETRNWERVADACGVPRFTLMALVGAAIARGEPHRRALDLLGVDVPPSAFRDDELYPDALPCLRALRERGLLVGAAATWRSCHEELVPPARRLRRSSSERFGSREALRRSSSSASPGRRAARRGDRLRRRPRRQRRRAGARRGHGRRARPARAVGAPARAAGRSDRDPTRSASCRRRSP